MKPYQDRNRVSAGVRRPASGCGGGGPAMPILCQDRMSRGLSIYRLARVPRAPVEPRPLVVVSPRHNSRSNPPHLQYTCMVISPRAHAPRRIGSTPPPTSVGASQSPHSLRPPSWELSAAHASASFIARQAINPHHRITEDPSHHGRPIASRKTHRITAARASLAVPPAPHT